MDQYEQINTHQTPAWQCSNPACQTTFTSPVQHCLTCGALLKDTLLSERFRIEALLGRGGMGAVYHATDLALGRAVAVKVLAPNVGTAGDAPQELRARFFREARLAAQLDHPNIVPVLHFDIDGPLAYLVMPLLTGGTLARRIHPHQPTDPVVVAGWLHQIAAALDFAHQRPQPIIHRDVKPSNLLFHEDGRLCLADFGIARVVAGASSGESTNLTRTGIVLGSLSYMAPEQINGHAVPASDQYSTGVLLYEALTGVLPFDAADHYGLIIQHASAEPPLPGEYVPNLPSGIDAVLVRVLAKQPDERFPTVGALAEAFEAALTSAPTSAIARPARGRATLPVAPRPTFPLDDGQSRNTPFLGELPTEAGTMLRPPPGRAPLFPGGPGVAPGGPPQKPPAGPGRRNWWMPALFASLAVILLCVLGLAGLGVLNHLAKTNAAAQTATSTVSSPASTPTLTPTQTEAGRFETMLLAAERNPPIFQDKLLKGDHTSWQVSTPGSFVSDGLRLPTRTLLKKADTTVHATNERPLALTDVEINVTVTASTVIYGLGFFPPDGPGHILFLGAGGFYAVMIANVTGNNAQPVPTQDFDLALAPGRTYPLEVFILRDQFVIFLDHTFITSAPFSPAFSGSLVFALFSVIQNDQPAANVTFSDLKMYPLS
jgi:serine/threonine protein kinase